MAGSYRKVLTHDDYDVVIVCPLEVEVSALRYMLDSEHACPSAREEGDSVYIYGSMSGHNVVLGWFPYGSQGIGEATKVAAQMKTAFPKARLRMLVGIGGGVPSQDHDIRLGDVVVGMPTGTSAGIVQYDLGKDTVNGFERKGFQEPPPEIWRQSVVKMQSDHRTLSNQILLNVNKMVERQPKLTDYKRPEAGQDVLYESTSTHASGERTCRRCDRARIVHRQSLREIPKIFYGIIASGNRVLKNADERDKIAQDAGGALCFEMEAAGLTSFGCLVIRGISDYADSHKNDDWHAHAAATAAGYVKELLTYMTPHKLRNPSSDSLIPCDSPEGRKVLRWLVDGQAKQLDFHSRWRSHLENSHQSGTGQWFLMCEKFIQWKSNPSQTLWCTGKPGAGKTVLMALAAQDIERTIRASRVNHVTSCLGLIFFSRERDNAVQLADLLSSLIRQLQGNYVSQELLRTSQAHEWDDTRPSESDLEQLFFAEAERFESTYVVIDALDECPEPTLIRLFQCLRRCQTKCPRFHILTSSVEHASFTHILGNSISLTISAKADDLAIFIDNEAQTHFNHLIKEDQTILERIIGILVGKADGMFLLVSEQLRYTIDSHPLSHNELLNLLESIPQGLRTIYDLRWKRISQQPRAEIAKDIIAWVSCSMRPLTIQELQVALATQKNDGTVIDPGALVPQDSIFRLCQGFLRADDQGQVMFVHSTARSYFYERCQERFPSVDDDICRRCLQYIASQPIGKVDDAFQLPSIRERFVFLNYAIRHWYLHASRCMSESLVSFICQILRASDISTQIGSLTIATASDLNDLTTESSRCLPQRVEGVHLAAFLGLWHVVRALVTSGTDINLQDSNGWTPLRWSICDEVHETSDRDQMIQWLLDQGAEVDITDESGDTTLLWALGQPEPKRIVRRTFENNEHVHIGRVYTVRPDATGTTWPTPVRLWCPKSALEMLIRHARDINKRNKQGVTALARAARNNQFYVVQQLLDLGADINIADHSKRTPLLWALRFSDVVVHYEELRFSGDTLLAFGDRLVFDFSHQHSLPEDTEAIVCRLVGRDLQVRDEDDLSPLDLAVGRGLWRIMKAILDSGVDINSANKDGMTALMWACSTLTQDFLTCDDLYLSQRAMAYLGNFYELTPDQTSVEHVRAYLSFLSESRRKVVRWLILRGASISMRNSRYLTATDLAYTAWLPHISADIQCFEDPSLSWSSVYHADLKHCRLSGHSYDTIITSGEPYVHDGDISYPDDLNDARLHRGQISLLMCASLNFKRIHVHDSATLARGDLYRYDMLNSGSFFSTVSTILVRIRRYLDTWFRDKYTFEGEAFLYGEDRVRFIPRPPYRMESILSSNRCECGRSRVQCLSATVCDAVSYLDAYVCCRCHCSYKTPEGGSISIPVESDPDVYQYLKIPGKIQQVEQSPGERLKRFFVGGR